MSANNAHAYLVECMSRGEEANLEKASDRIIDAGEIRALLVGRKERAAAANSALRIRGAHVRGSLDLSLCGSAGEPLPALAMTECRFDSTAPDASINLSNAHIGGLDLSDSTLTCLRGIGVKVAGSINLSGIRAGMERPAGFCWCNLSRAVIDGHVLADDVKLRAPEPRDRVNRHELDAAFNLYMSRITGSVMIGARKDEGATIDGGLMLDSARVGGDVRIDSATILPFDFFALALERARIDGSLTLARALEGRPTVCRGRVWMWRATIGGSLDLMGAELSDPAPERICLFAEDVCVRGQVRFENVNASGRANLRRLQSESVIHVSGVNSEAVIDLRNARCAEVELRQQDGATCIRNDGLTFNRIESAWIRDERRFDEWLPREGTAYRPQPYIQLAQVLAKEGEEAKARNVLLKKAWRDARRNWYERDAPRSVKLGATGFLRLTVRRGVYACVAAYGLLFQFGLSPLRAAATFVASIALGVVMFWWIDHQEALVVSQTRVAGYMTQAGRFAALTVQDASPTNIPCGDSIRLPVYALDIFLPLIDLREEGKCEIDAAGPPPSTPPASPDWRSIEVTIYRSLKAGYAIAGWVVTTLALLTFAGVMRHRLLAE